MERKENFVTARHFITTITSITAAALGAVYAIIATFTTDIKEDIRYNRQESKVAIKSYQDEINQKIIELNKELNQKIDDRMKFHVKQPHTGTATIRDIDLINGRQNRFEERIDRLHTE